MGEASPPTAADWAANAAHNAEDAARAAQAKNVSLEARVAHLERQVKLLLVHAFGPFE